MSYLKNLYIFSLLFLLLGFVPNISSAKEISSELKCPAQTVFNKETGFCKGKEESFCPLNQILNSSSTACTDSCETNEKPYGGQCINVCTGDKIQGISGLVCPNGKTGISMQRYREILKNKE